MSNSNNFFKHLTMTRPKRMRLNSIEEISTPRERSRLLGTRLLLSVRTRLLRFWGLERRLRDNSLLQREGMPFLWNEIPPIRLETIFEQAYLEDKHFRKLYAIKHVIARRPVENWAAFDCVTCRIARSRVSYRDFRTCYHL